MCLLFVLGDVVGAYVWDDRLKVAPDLFEQNCFPGDIYVWK
jgi:hypothetical protein